MIFRSHVANYQRVSVTSIGRIWWSRNVLLDLTSCFGPDMFLASQILNTISIHIPYANHGAGFANICRNKITLIYQHHGSHLGVNFNKPSISFSAFCSFVDLYSAIATKLWKSNGQLAGKVSVNEHVRSVQNLCCGL